MNALHFAERLPLRVPPDALWRFLYDTDRLNRSLKLPSINFTPHPDRRLKGHYTAELKLGPIALRYEEFPFEWVERRFYRVVRRFNGGPFAEISGGIRIRPDGDGSELEIYSDVTPRGVVGGTLAKALMRKMAISGVVAQVRAFESGYASIEKNLPMSAAEVSPNQLESRMAALAETPVEPSFLPRLKDLLRSASDTEVTRIRPFELADRWEAERYDVLRLFLYATKTGLVDLKWEILCPHCRAPSETGSSLSDIRPESACLTCETNFRVDLANSVEAVFAVNLGVRVARRSAFCIGGPANTPRVMAQFRLEPGEERRETVACEPGLLAVRSYQSTGVLPLEVLDSGSPEVSITCGPALSISSARLASGSANLALKNTLDRECLVVVEHETWRETAATAAIVATIQEFRDLFPQEAVAPGQEIAVGRLTVLFTDLQGSTDLYERIGDIKAFDFVQSHFQYLVRLVAKHRGGVVKTMGDAIMASFNSALDGASAAVAMQEEWAAFMTKYSLPTEVGLKVGLHQGPAVAFNNKGLLDYFGTTVNMAARIQGQSKGGEIVVSEAVRTDPDARRFIEARFSAIDAFTTHLKGIAQDQTLFRLRASSKTN